MNFIKKKKPFVLVKKLRIISLTHKSENKKTYYVCPELMFSLFVTIKN